MLEMLCWIDSRRGAYDRAATLLGAASTQWGRIGSAITVHGPQLATHHEECAANVRLHLGARRFAKLVNEGSQLTPQEAVAFAFAPPHSPPGALSGRERDVASGIHRGMSNREIADELVLSVRTVENHLQHAYSKLGVSGRSELAGLI